MELLGEELFHNNIFLFQVLTKKIKKSPRNRHVEIMENVNNAFDFVGLGEVYVSDWSNHQQPSPETKDFSTEHAQGQFFG